MDSPADKTILIVDDEPDIRDVLAISLMDMGYRTMEAENSARAFELFLGESPQIVVTDIKMPGGDGIQLLRKIKRENPETEVIMITGHGDMNLAVRSLKYEATDFITKPINVDALEIALNRALEKIAMRRTLRDYTCSLEQLVREKSQLQDHLASLGLMIGSISHGMKGLLTNLDGGLYLVGSGLDKEDLETARQGCTVACETAERIRKMVLDILYTAKRRELKPSAVDAVRFAEELAGLIRPRVEAYDIDLKCRFDEAAGEMVVDADALQAAMINILDNAVDACLNATDEKPHHIEFSMDAGPEEIVFTITDDGTGMDSETREKIFTLFYSTKACKGTGLGLFITSRIVAQHGGTIAVDSAIGKGTTFKLTLPRKPEKNAG